MAATLLGVVAASSVADALELSPQQRADAAMGTADARLQLPGSAPLGTDGSALDDLLRGAVLSAGGLEPTIDYVASGIRADNSDETSYALEEIQSEKSVEARLQLLSGRWPIEVAEGLVSEASAALWPVGSEVHFFNGALSIQIVGTFRNSFNTEVREFLVPPGTWSSLAIISDDLANRLDQSAGRVLAWHGGGDATAILTAVVNIAESYPSLRESLDTSSDVSVETRTSIESSEPAKNVPFLFALIAAPIVAGLLSAIIAGAFTRRVRTAMWTIGVPYRHTRIAAALAVLGAGAAGAALGTGIGVVGGIFIRPLLVLVSTQELSPISSSYVVFVSVPLALAGLGVGVASSDLALRRKIHPDISQERAWDRVLYRVVGAVLLASLGIFIGSDTVTIASMSVAAIAIGMAVTIVVVPLCLSILSKLSPRSFASRLAIRKLAQERRSASVTLTVLAGLLVLESTLALMVSSLVTELNDNTESAVKTGQVVFEPLLKDQASAETARAQFEDVLGVNSPIVVLTVGMGNDRRDGATKVVESAEDLERVLGLKLTAEQRSFFKAGGTLLTKPFAGNSVSFPPTAGFSGVSFDALVIAGIDPSFRNIDGCYVSGHR